MIPTTNHAEIVRRFCLYVHESADRTHDRHLMLSIVGRIIDEHLAMYRRSNFVETAIAFMEMNIENKHQFVQQLYRSFTVVIREHGVRFQNALM